MCKLDCFFNMKPNFAEKLLKIFVLFGILISQIDALECYQCNIFIRGSPWPCNSERGMKRVPDCHACLKTFTRSYLHNTFHDELHTSYESRLCVKAKEYVRDAGCHARETASGYMKRCFCYDDLCNSSSRVRTTFTITGLCLLSASFLKRFL